MTQIGFSGNDRYLILGAALVEIAGGVGFGWAALELGRGLAAPARASALGWPVTAGDRRLGVSRARSRVVFMLLPTWIGGLVHLRVTHRALVYQAHLRTDMAKASSWPAAGPRCSPAAA